MNKVRVVHQALWSAVGMIVVVVIVVLAAYRFLHHERFVCGPSIIGHRTVTSYDPAYIPPEKTSVSITPIILCKDGSVIKP